MVYNFCSVQILVSILILAHEILPWQQKYFYFSWSWLLFSVSTESSGWLQPDNWHSLDIWQPKWIHWILQSWNVQRMLFKYWQWHKHDYTLIWFVLFIISIANKTYLSNKIFNITTPIPVQCKRVLFVFDVIAKR